MTVGCMLYMHFVSLTIASTQLKGADVGMSQLTLKPSALFLW